MASLALAAAFFLGIHFGIAGSRLRDGLIDRIGLLPYLGVFSALSLVGLVWMCSAYADAPYQHFWAAGPFLRSVVLLAVLVAFVLVVLGLTTPNPTQVGSDALLEQSPEPAVGILRVTRHPFLCGVALWAVAHLAANGDGASLLFFGALAVLAALGPLSIDRRKARLAVPGWQAYAAATSVLPFAAIAQGRNRLELGEFGAWRVALAVGVFALVLGVHASLFGASPLPG